MALLKLTRATGNFRASLMLSSMSALSSWGVPTIIKIFTSNPNSQAILMPSSIFSIVSPFLSDPNILLLPPSTPKPTSRTPICFILFSNCQSTLSARIPFEHRINNCFRLRLSISSQISQTLFLFRVKLSSSIANCLYPLLYQYSISPTKQPVLFVLYFRPNNLFGQNVH